MNDEESRKYFGKYRGVVTGNNDPMQLGRIQAKVPDVLGEHESTWAMPSMPYAGRNVGLFLIPPTDAQVWIEFEHGDPDYPIWTGCFWDSGEVPASPAVPEMKVLKTDAGTITLNDQKGSGSITIETTAGLKIVMNTNGIEISNGSQKVTVSSSSISINDGALEVE
jgi:uncharacterized protein involved in type VI secretion and phage assembly